MYRIVYLLSKTYRLDRFIFYTFDKSYLAYRLESVIYSLNSKAYEFINIISFFLKFVSI